MMIQQISAVSIKLTYTAGQCHILTDLPTRQELYSQTGRGSTKIYQVNEEGWSGNQSVSWSWKGSI